MDTHWKGKTMLLLGGLVVGLLTGLLMTALSEGHGHHRAPVITSVQTGTLWVGAGIAQGTLIIVEVDVSHTAVIPAEGQQWPPGVQVHLANRTTVAVTRQESSREPMTLQLRVIEVY